MRIVSIIAILLAAALAGCSGDDPASPGDADTTPPARVTDLRVVTSKMALTVAWTAPGDDGTDGQAAEYDIRYAGEPITAENFSAYHQVSSAPAPAAAGTEQSVYIDAPGYANLFVALRTADEVPNWSAMSNVVSDAYVPGLEVRQLTDEGFHDHPCLYDGIVSWVGWMDGDDGYEIYVANLDVAYPSPSRLTDNGGEKAHPASHGTEIIVWQGREGPGEDWEIWAYSPTSVPRYWAHTDDEIHDRYPVLAGAGNYAWLHGPTMFEEVRYWNAALHSESVISDDCCPAATHTNESLTADDFTVVWRSSDRAGVEGYATYMWTGATTDISDDVESPMSTDYSLHDDQLAYQYGASPAEIHFWDGAAVHNVANGYAPSLHAGTIAYEVWDGQDWEIHYWDGSQILEITDNAYNDTQPSLHGNKIAWIGRPGGGSSADHVFYAILE